MKPFKIFRKLVILFTATIGLSLKLPAQVEEYTPGTAPVLPVNGYAILSNGDTIYGKLRWTLKYVENNPVEIKFFAENGAEKTLKAGEIKGFGNSMEMWLGNTNMPISSQVEHYVSLPSYKKGVPVFINRLIDGPITIYQNRSSLIYSSSKVIENTRIDGIGFSFSPGEGLSIGPTYRTDYRIIKGRTRFSSYFVSKDKGPLVKVDKDNYEELFKTFFGDCPAMAQEIEKNPDLLKFKNFMIIVEVYNQVCNGKAGNM
jgi:hypothetical protein